jgi:hypothetical protein
MDTSKKDRLYELLPAIYRMRDYEQGEPLRALLQVIAEQVEVVEQDIGQLYENWFIETCEDWVVPYIGDLVGYRPVSEEGEAGGDTSPRGRALNRILVPRREVANTVRYRRRKGALSLLEELARDVAGWPARAVEFFKLLAWNQNINALHLDRAKAVDVRSMEDLDLLEGPFERLAHGVDVRRISSRRTARRYNIPSVGVFIWRLKPYSVTRSPAYYKENEGDNCFTFSAIGRDTRLFVKPEQETESTHIAEEKNVPVPIKRSEFARHPERYYGMDRSFTIHVDGWPGCEAAKPVPIGSIIPADLTNWDIAPPLNQIAVDPVLGRLTFHVDQEIEKDVRVTCHYGFSADIGGGEYIRDIYDPSPRKLSKSALGEVSEDVSHDVEQKFYRVGAEQEFQTIQAALDQWNKDTPLDGVIELTDSDAYTEAINIDLLRGQTLQIRAASGVRPVIRLLDWETSHRDALTVTMSRGSRFTMDGLLVAGRGVHIHELKREKKEDPRERMCGAEVIVRHCTLVPRRGHEPEGQAQRHHAPASLELHHIRATLRIEHSILGSIQIHEDEVREDPIPVYITDSIIDAMGHDREAIGAPGHPVAHAVLTIRRCTVFGVTDVHAIELAENCIFNNCLNVARRQLGCMRFCYVAQGCRTPRRYNCQPDLVDHSIAEEVKRGNIARSEEAALQESERRRVRPRYTSVHYGEAGYSQLAFTCADEIKRGADDGSEMGVFHDLYQPQREASLLARLEEYTPAGIDAGIIIVT